MNTQDSLHCGDTLEACSRLCGICSFPAVRHQSLIPRYSPTKVLIFLLVVSAFNPVMAMIHTLPFPTLVKEADLIVIARVADKVPIPQGEQKYPQLKNVLVIEQVLKGTRRQNEPIAILTVDTRGKWKEDAVTFPNKGQRVVLFLSGSGDSLRIVNGIQGVWPLEDGTDKTLGMGFRYSIRQIEEEIAGSRGRQSTPKGNR